MPTSEFKLTFDAVYYHVRDIEKSIAFYRDILGVGPEVFVAHPFDDLRLYHKPGLAPSAPGGVAV
jgi:catechol 2,3-dioxygenase-like lactoylglutathione lyase family enzyme